ncbi:MAG: hypothetical protein AAGC95_17605 [Pseudomonadota bacterium]
MMGFATYKLIRAMAICGLSGLVACAGGAGAPNVSKAGDGPARPSPPASGDLSDEGFRLAELPPRQMAPGECGMFLWSLPPQPRLVYFSGDDRRGAVMNIAGAEVRFARTEVSGDAFFQQYSEQSFVSPTEMRLDVSVALGEETASGLTLPSGALRLSQANGWEMVAPVTGIAGCRNPDRP